MAYEVMVDVVTTYVVMAHTGMAFIAMACTVTVYIVMACAGMAFIVMPFIGQYSHGHNQIR